jgi:Fe-S-cluster containining protein
MKTIELEPFSEELHTEIKTHFATDHAATSKVDALAIIYRMLDKIMAEMSRQAHCKPGCKWCCNIATEILPIEAEYIQEHTDHKIDIHPMGKLDYCQFLVDDMCSIYDYRPFNCRAFLSFESPDYCKDSKPHLTTGGPENGYGNGAILNLGYQLCMLETGMPMTKAIMPVLRKRTKDIREFFR